MNDDDKDQKAGAAHKADRRDQLIKWFYYAHAAPLVAIAFVLNFELFTKISLVYTTTVSAITAGATYAARGKASAAEAAGYENP